MQKKIIITGINGFVGHHLARELSSQGVSVIGVSYEEKLFDSLDGVVDEYYSADLVSTWPETGSVDSVIHLAGFAAIGPSFEAPQRYINGNSAMVTNLCEYYLSQSQKPRILLVSSGAIYDPNQDMPITENGSISLSSPYAISKILNENQAAYYHARGLECTVVRPFNHIGPGQGKGFILPDLFARLAENNDVIKVGNLDTRRDYTDVRDIVKAYSLIALAPSLEHPVYNVCSGKSFSGVEIFEALKAAVNRPDVTFTVDPSMVRPNDTPDIVGGSSRLQDELGWKPQIPLEQTIHDFVSWANTQ